MGSWMECECSWSTFMTKWQYCFFLVSSRLRTVVATDSAVQLLLSRVTRSGKISKNGFPIRLIVSTRLTTCCWNVYCVERPCSRWWRLLNISVLSPWMHSSSNCLSSLAISGPESIHRLQAEGFCVSPIALSTPFTVLFSCSWAWSKGIAENVFLHEIMRRYRSKVAHYTVSQKLSHLWLAITLTHMNRFWYFRHKCYR